MSGEPTRAIVEITLEICIDADKVSSHRKLASLADKIEAAAVAEAGAVWLRWKGFRRGKTFVGSM